MSDEEVLPSDEEELEEVLALRRGYWTDAARSSVRNSELYGPQRAHGETETNSTVIEDVSRLSPSREETQSSPPRRLGVRASRSDDEGAGRPRKRAKLGQSYSAENIIDSQSSSLKILHGSVSSTALGSTRAIGRDISNVSPSYSPHAVALILPIKDASKSPIPDTHEIADGRDSLSVEHAETDYEDSTSHVGGIQPGLRSCTPEMLPPASLDPLLLGSQMPVDCVMEDYVHPRQSSQSYATPSPSPTVDPLNLFSPPSPSPPRPRRSNPNPTPDLGYNTASLQHRVSSRTEVLMDPSPRALPHPPLLLSSPGAGPSRITRTPSPRRDGSSPLSSPEQGPVVPAEKASEEVSREDIASAEELQKQDGGRYSLRKRQVWQVKPYAYERRKYTRSLREAAPEAIVDSSERHRRARSPGDITPSSDQDVDPNLLDQADSDDDYRQRNRRIRSVSGDDEPIIPHPRPRPPPKLPSPRAKPPAKQYPKSMQETFESSDNDSDRSAPIRPTKVHNDKGKKSRKRPFPMRGPLRRSKSRSRILSEDPEDPPDLPVAQDSDHDGFEARDSAHVRSSSPIDDQEQADWQILSEVSSSPIRRLTSPHDDPPTSSHVSATSHNDILTDDPTADDTSERPSSPPSPSQRSISVEIIDGDPSQEESITNDRSRLAGLADDAEYDRVLEEALGKTQAEILKKTMPWHMIIRELEKEKQASAKRKQKLRRHIEDSPLKPGQARRKTGTTHREREIRGDEESSDAEMLPDRSPSSSPPASYRPVARSRTSPERVAQRYDQWIPDTIVISSSDEDEDTVDEGAEIREILYDNDDGAVKERSLIDYMRPRGGDGSSQGRGKSSTSRPRAKRSGTRGVKRKRVDVAVGGSRRHDGERQTLLTFVPVKLPGRTRTPTKHATRVKQTKSRGDSSSRPIAEPSRVVSKSNRDPSPEIDIAVGMPRITTSSKKKKSAEKSAEKSVEKSAWKKDRIRARDRVYFSEAKHLSTVQFGRSGGQYTTTVVEFEAPERQSIKLVRRVLDARPIHRQRKGGGRGGDSVRGAPLRRDEDDHAIDYGTLPAAAKQTHSSNVYLDISKLPSGVAFAQGTYLGSGYLHAMFAAPTDAPRAGYIGENVVTDSTSTAELRDVLDKELTALLSSISESPQSVTVEDHRTWQGYLHDVCRWSRWRIITGSGDELQELRHILQSFARCILDIVREQFAVLSDDSAVSLLTLDLQWAAIELLHYMRPSADEPTSEGHSQAMLDHVKLIMQRLWAFNKRLGGELYRLPLSETLDYKLPRHRVAELWICVIHLTLHNTAIGITKSTFWDLLSEVIDQLGLLKLYGKQTVASEALWTAIYGLSALSQFSRHGLSTSTLHLPPCWKFVAWTLKKLNIANDLATDSGVPEEGLKRRDKFFKVLVGRCVALCERWNWPLDNSSPMLEQLLQRFRARRFGNLRGERAGFPSFMLAHDLSRLHGCHDKSDTAFQLFLKLVVRAASTIDERGRPSVIRPPPPMVRKLLSLAVPLGTVPFTESSPASSSELAMLYNRFTAISVAIYLDPTEASVGSRLVHAARYVELRTTNWPTRRVCVEGWTHLAILLQHFALSLKPALQWFSDMADCVANEVAPLDDDAVANHPATAIQLLLLERALKMLETPRMNHATVEARYPNPDLLDGPWIPQPGNKFAAVPKVRNSVRILIEAFLKARTTFFPNRSRRSVQPAPREESQDSQDLWGEFDMVFEDLAPTPEEVMDKRFAELIDKSLLQCVYNQLTRQCKVVHSTRQDARNADRWLEYYIHVALVVVQNRLKEWAYYIAMGPMKWTYADYNADTLREWQTKLMLTILQVDPPAYAAEFDVFLDYLFQCIVLPLSSDKTTHVVDYIAAVFTLDGLQHPFLVGVPCQPVENYGLFQLTLDEFLDNRVAYLERIFLNVEHTLCDFHYDLDVRRKNVSAYLKSMVNAIQDAHKNMRLEDKRAYTSFCTGIAGLLAQHPKLSQNQHVQSFQVWTTKI